MTAERTEVDRPQPHSQTAATLDIARQQDRAALIGYLPVGFPSVSQMIAAGKTLIEAGADIVELGLPYSDPVMDGPVIAEASATALAGGTRVADTLATVEALAPLGAPILVMTYYNPVFHYGVEAFARDLAAAGGAGLVTPDLIVDEAGEWMAASDRHGLDRVFVVAPSSPDARLALTAAATRGFVYAASAMGVTGMRASLGDRAADLVARTRAQGAEHVCVGLGVSTREQAAEVAAFADGVIVGSALVRALAEAPNAQAGRASLAHLAAQLALGVRSRAS